MFMNNITIKLIIKLLREQLVHIFIDIVSAVFSFALFNQIFLISCKPHTDLDQNLH